MVLRMARHDRRDRPDRAGLLERGEPARAVLEADGAAARRDAAIAFERALIRGCADRLAQLDEPGILRTVATVMASHAQHLALLERAAGRDPLSSAA